MPEILNITNGDCMVDIIRDASIPGAKIPWRDALHGGSVTDTLSLEALSELRAPFIIQKGWAQHLEAMLISCPALLIASEIMDQGLSTHVKVSPCNYINKKGGFTHKRSLA